MSTGVTAGGFFGQNRKDVLHDGVKHAMMNKSQNAAASGAKGVLSMKAVLKIKSISKMKQVENLSKLDLAMKI